MKFKKFMALALAGVMAMGMTGTALAADEGPDVQKTVVVAEGITVNQEIKFTATQADKNPDNTTMPALPTGWAISATINYYNQSRGSFVKTDKIDVTPALNDWKAGEYTFVLTEDQLPAKDAEGYGWTAGAADGSEVGPYYLHMYLTKDAAGTASATWAFTTDNTVTETKANPYFTNQFTKKGGSEDEVASLEISKIVANGTYADPDTEYEFTVSFTVPGTVPAMPADGYAYTVEGGTSGAITANGGTIKLKDGQKASFANIPAGVTVAITEAKAPNVETVSCKYVSNGGTEQEGQESVSFLIGEKTNTAVYTNTYTEITPTGLAISVALFVAMFAAVGAAIALYVAAKRRVR